MTDLPSHAPVIVIGGGIMGCSTLYHLAKLGVHDAILIERNKLTSGTTWHSAAQVRALRSTQNMTNLIKYSIDLYQRLEAETGQATGWINEGSISIATNPERLTHIKRQEALARLFGVRAASITPDQAQERWPLMNGADVVGAVWSPDDGRVSPSDLCAALIKGARSSGAKIFEDTAVTGILTKGGTITGVETSRGSIRCDKIAVCAGLWSKEAAAMAGAAIPVWPCEHFYLLTDGLDAVQGNLPTLSDHDNHLYIRDDSGGLLIGCFEPKGKVIDPARLGSDFAFQLLDEDWDHFEPMMERALHRLPVLENAPVKMLLNGPESFTPDGGFLLGESAETKDLYLGCGMNSVGIATGGGAGMALAHTIVDGYLPMDLHEVDAKRFDPAFTSIEALSARVPEVLGKHYEITFPGRQWQTARHLKKLPLHDRHTAENAHLGQFQAFERPLYFNAHREPNLTFGRPDWFEQAAREVDAAHRKAALFDQSSFGKIKVAGPDAERFLDRVCTNDMTKPEGSMIYTMMLNDQGGIESDLTAQRLGPETYRLFVGTGAIRRDLSWLKRQKLAHERVELTDETDDWAVIGLMGPEVRSIAPELGTIRYFRHASTEIAGIEVQAARISYVGEYGFEITCKAADAANLFDHFRSLDAVPAGLFAQTSMRIEKRFLAYGHEIDTGITPIEAGLGFALAKNRAFVGSQALQDRPRVTRIVSLIFDDIDANPLGNEPISIDGRIIGKTTSTSFGHRVGAPVALASITASVIVEDCTVSVDIAGSSTHAQIVDGAVFDPSGSRMRG